MKRTNATFVFLDGAGEETELVPEVRYNVDYETVHVDAFGGLVFTHYVSPKDGSNGE